MNDNTKDSIKKLKQYAIEGKADGNLIEVMACEGNADEKLDVKGLNEVVKIIKGSK